MSAIEQIRRTLQTHTPAGKDKRHDGCSCFAEALAALDRVEAVIEAAQFIDMTISHKPGTEPTPLYGFGGGANGLHAALNLSPSTPAHEHVYEDLVLANGEHVHACSVRLENGHCCLNPAQSTPVKEPQE